MPYDPVSNTSGIFSAGRFYTNHELDMPLKFFNAVRLVPYRPGALGRMDRPAWRRPAGPLPLGRGPCLGRRRCAAEMTLYKKYPHVPSEIMNVHGLNNKISLFADARAAFSNVRLNNLAVQDDLDDNTYEAVRRYLAITTFAGGYPADAIRPPAPPPSSDGLADHRHDRRPGRPSIPSCWESINGSRPSAGPIGRRRIVDYMTLDATTTYFPDPAATTSARRGARPLQLSVVPRRPDEHRLPGLVRILEAGRQ